MPAHAVFTGLFHFILTHAICRRLISLEILRSPLDFGVLSTYLFLHIFPLLVVLVVLFLP